MRFCVALLAVLGVAAVHATFVPVTVPGCAQALLDLEPTPFSQRCPDDQLSGYGTNGLFNVAQFGYNLDILQGLEQISFNGRRQLQFFIPQRNNTPFAVQTPVIGEYCRNRVPTCDSVSSDYGNRILWAGILIVDLGHAIPQTHFTLWTNSYPNDVGCVTEVNTAAANGKPVVILSDDVRTELTGLGDIWAGNHPFKQVWAHSLVNRLPGDGHDQAAVCAAKYDQIAQIYKAISKATASPDDAPCVVRQARNCNGYGHFVKGQQYCEYAKNLLDGLTDIRQPDQFHTFVSRVDQYNYTYVALPPNIIKMF